MKKIFKPFRRRINVSAGDNHVELIDILSSFKAPIRYAVAYGSGAYKQLGYEQSTSDGVMVDFIFGVTHAEHWHSLNIRQNPTHYSAIKALGTVAVCNIQEKFGARIYYNPDITVNGRRIKYGVISMHHLLRDLEEWETYYIAGRLQKPVRVLRDEPKVRLAMNQNLSNAMNVALLLLPQTFTEQDLFLKIAGLSYSGDFRMRIGENPHKIQNIVNAQMDEFRLNYGSVIDNSPGIIRHTDGILEQDMSSKTRGSMIQSLPKNAKENLHQKYLWQLYRDGIMKVIREEPTFSQSIAEHPKLNEIISTTIKEIVAKPVLIQSLKGIITGGFVKSIKYALAKIHKMNKAKQ